MAEISKIAWTDATFNPWIGCAKISEGCKHCYASVDTFARRSRANGLELWGVDAARHRTAVDYWKKPLRWNREATETGVRRRVFCASLADVFEDRRDLDPWRADLFALIEATPALDWLLLMKRPESIMRLVPESWRERFPPNVWQGTTVENQEAADRRVPELLRVPAAVRFLSVEPMIGAVDLDLPRCEDHDRDEVQILDGEECCNECAASGYSGELSYGHWLDACADVDQPGINWVIVGGESGPGARPFDLAWAASISEQCRAAGVPYFFKQAGAFPCLSNVNATDVSDEHLLDGPAGVDGAAAFRLAVKDRKGGDVAERARVLPDLAAAGVFRREFPAARP